MVYVSAHKSRILAADFHLSPKVAQVGAPTTTDMLDVTTLADQARAFIPGGHTSTFTISGFLDTDGAADSHFDQLNDWVTAEPVTWAPSGLVIGQPVWLVNSLKTQFGTGAKVADSVRFDLACQTDGRTDMGVSLHDLTAETGNLDGASVDNGASSALGGVGHLHVTAYSGFTSVTIRVQDSPDNSVWGNRLTFTAVTGVTSERATATPTTVDRYTRCAVTVTGTGSITFQAGFARR